MKAVRTEWTDGFLYTTLNSDTDTVKKRIADHYYHCDHSLRLMARNQSQTMWVEGRDLI